MKALFSPDKILFDLPFKHNGIMCAPFIGPVSIRQYFSAGQIEQVICGGENYDGARPCNFDWVKSLRQECVDEMCIRDSSCCGTGR